MNLKENFDHILRELEFRTGEIVDLTKISHRSMLNEILCETGYESVASDIINNLVEGPNDGDNAKTSREVERDDEYTGIGGSTYVKTKDFIPNAAKGEDHFKPGAKKYKKDGDKYVPLSGDDTEKDEPAGELTPKPTDTTASDEKSDKEVEQDELDAETKANVKKTMGDDNYQKQIKDEEAAATSKENTVDFYNVGGDLYSDTPNGKPKYKKVKDVTNEDKGMTSSGKEVIVEPIKVDKPGKLSDMNDTNSDGKVKQLALDNGTKNVKVFKPAPGNAGSMYNEIMSGEVYSYLKDNPDASDADLIEKMYQQTKDTTLGKEYGGVKSGELSVEPKGKYTGYNKKLLFLVRDTVSSGKVKYNRTQSGIDVNGMKDSISYNYYGHDQSLTAQTKLIKSHEGPFLTSQGVEIPKDTLLTLIENSGGGENPSDTSTITVSSDGKVMVEFHSDKMSTKDIQANSTPNKESEQAIKLIEGSNLSGLDKQQSTQIIQNGQSLLSTKERELKSAANSPARELRDGNITQILADIKSDKGIDSKAKVNSHLKASLISRGNPHPNIKKYLPEQEESHTEEQLLKAFYEYMGDDDKITGPGSPTDHQMKLLYRSAKQNGYDISASLGKIREESLQIQRDTQSKLNERNITLKSGESKPLGTYIEGRNLIDKLHLDVIDGEDGHGVGKYKGLFSVNMSGTIVESKQLTHCLGIDDTDDFIEHFEVGTPGNGEEVYRNKETGQVTGNNIFVYAITKNNKRIPFAYKTQRSKQGESGKLSTTYQYHTNTQKCFKENQ